MPIRVAFLYTTLVLAAWSVLITEVLSACHFITRTGVILGWLLPALIIAVYLRKKHTPILHILHTLLHEVKTSWIFLLITGLSGISLLLALAYPTNNYDSLTYHMARVAHWVQNGSIAYYPTHVGRQLIFQPFAEWVILQVQLLTGGDRLANTVQWLFFIGCISNITLITKDLGGTPRQQLYSGLITCLIPMALLQSNTTQNDIVTAWFVLSFIHLTIHLQKTSTPLLLIMAGLALGLAWLTKGTAYLFTLPFIAWYNIPLIKSPSKKTLSRIAGYTLIPLIALLINSGFFYRNLSATGYPFGQAHNDIAAEGHAIKPLALIAVKNIMGHFPINDRMKQQLIHRSAVLGINADDPKYSYTPTRRMAEGFYFDEDYAQNFIHIILILAALGYFLSRKDLYRGRMNYYKLFVLTTIASAALFCILLKWQPWGNRLETTLFMQCSVLLAITGAAARKWVQAAALTLMIGYGTIALLFNAHHPILPLKKSILQKPYETFIYTPSLLECKKYLDQKPYTQLGICIGGDSPDYPYYKLLASSGGHTRRLEHVMVDNGSSVFDKGYIPEAIISMKATKEQYTLHGKNYYRTRIFSDSSALFEQK